MSAGELGILWIINMSFGLESEANSTSSKFCFLSITVYALDLLTLPMPEAVDGVPYSIDLVRPVEIPE